MIFFLLTLSCDIGFASANPGDGEYTGTLDGELVAHTEDVDQVVFHPLRDLSRVKLQTPIESGSYVTAGRLFARAI
jgi:hypothetical protein